MALQFFAYITYNGGKADDSALELLAAAKKIDAGAAVTAVVTGSGCNLVADFFISGADAFISGDLRYHEVREIEYVRRGAIDIGHFHSEHLMAEALTRRLQRASKSRRVGVRVQACPLEKDPFTVL